MTAEGRYFASSIIMYMYRILYGICNSTCICTDYYVWNLSVFIIIIIHVQNIMYVIMYVSSNTLQYMY